MGGENPPLPDLLNDLATGIVIYHPETGAILGVNDRAERLFGYPESALRELAVSEYTAPSRTVSREEATERLRAAADGDPQSFVWQIERANGEFRWVRVDLNRSSIAGTDCVVAEIDDITEYKDRERLLQLVTRVIRHNLRNDMTVLIGYAERLKDAVESDTVTDEIETILDVAVEVGNLSDSIKEIERITNPDTLERAEYDLRSMAEESVADVRTSHPAGTITVTGPENVRVVADDGLRYALNHAIRNALEHNDREEPTATVAIGLESGDDTGVVRIEDDGPPIPQMEIDALDESIETSSTYHGSGVGLWVMKWCVESLGGELRFETRDGRGNVVSIAVPAADSA